MFWLFVVQLNADRDGRNRRLMVMVWILTSDELTVTDDDDELVDGYTIDDSVPNHNRDIYNGLNDENIDSLHVLEEAEGKFNLYDPYLAPADIPKCTLE